MNYEHLEDVTGIEIIVPERSVITTNKLKQPIIFRLYNF